MGGGGGGGGGQKEKRRTAFHGGWRDHGVQLFNHVIQVVLWGGQIVDHPKRKPKTTLSKQPHTIKPTNHNQTQN